MISILDRIMVCTYGKNCQWNNFDYEDLDNISAREPEEEFETDIKASPMDQKLHLKHPFYRYMVGLIIPLLPEVMTYAENTLQNIKPLYERVDLNLICFQSKT